MKNADSITTWTEGPMSYVKALQSNKPVSTPSVWYPDDAHAQALKELEEVQAELVEARSDAAIYSKGRDEERRVVRLLQDELTKAAAAEREANAKVAAFRKERENLMAEILNNLPRNVPSAYYWIERAAWEENRTELERLRAENAALQTKNATLWAERSIARAENTALKAPHCDHTWSGWYCPSLFGQHHEARRYCPRCQQFETSEVNGQPYQTNDDRSDADIAAMWGRPVRSVIVEEEQP